MPAEIEFQNWRGHAVTLTAAEYVGEPSPHEAPEDHAKRIGLTVGRLIDALVDAKVLSPAQVREIVD